MKTELALQILIASMAVLGTAILSVSGGSMTMVGVMLAAAAASVVFCDVLGWLRLHRFLVNFAALAAMFIFLRDFLRNDSFTQLMSMGQLLMWWQIVMLFQEKTARVYWCVAILSLLQIVVASILNVGLQIGPLMFVFTLTGLLATMIFHLHREMVRMEQQRRAARRAMHSPQQTLQGLLLGGPPIAMADQTAVGLERTFSPRSLLGPAVALSVVTTMFAALFFYGAPRLGDSRWRSVRTGVQAETGFSDSVSFMEMGQILQSRRLVMRVDFSDYADRTPYTMVDDAYYHGAALERYDAGEQTWHRTPVRWANGHPLKSPPREVTPGVDMVHQNILMEPTTTSTLFGIMPSYVDPLDQQLEWEPRAQQLRRLDDDGFGENLTRQFRYTLVTPALRSGNQVAISPHYVWGHVELLDSERARLTEIPRNRFPRLTETANAIVSKLEGASNRLVVAFALQSHFSEDNGYRYSLDFSEVAKVRRRDVDPIEDFVANHRTGHCQYFAAALVMMLRSQSIPARLVVGYHGGTYNRMGGYYQISQDFAHAWVEAYLEKDEMPPGLQTVAATEPTHSGGWLRLDPTPPSALGREVGDRRDALDEFLDYARLLWNDYVLELDPKRQRQSIYNPFEKSAANLRRLLDLQSWGVFFRNFWGQLGDRVANLLRNGVGWREGLIAMMLCGAAVALFVGVRRFWLRLRARRRRAAERGWQLAAVRVDFYERLERLLDRVGLKRAPHQTQQEWAETALRQLREQPQLQGVAGTPLEVVEAFYRVRFGRRELEPAQRRQVQSALDQLEASLQQT